MAKTPAILAACVVASFALPAAAQSPLCPQQDADAAEAMVDTIRSWKDVDVIYAKYRNCDDGSIAEGNAEAIANILVKHWDTLPDLVGLSSHEPGLQAFVLNHVNQTIDTAELRRIASLSTTSCPTSAEPLCKKLHEAASSQGASTR